MEIEIRCDVVRVVTNLYEVLAKDKKDILKFYFFLENILYHGSRIVMMLLTFPFSVIVFYIEI